MNPKPISTLNASHYIWAEGCEGWHLLQNDELSVIEEQMQPNTSEVMHYHKKAKQVFYILKGVATMIFENESVTISAGESLYIPELKAHQLSNKSNELLRFLVISSPKSHNDKVIV